MCGLPGSGKTTLAKELAATRGAVRLSPDEWMTALGFAAYDEANRLRVEALQWEHAQELALLGVDVILENGFWAREERELIRDWCRGHGVEVELRFLDAPLEVLEQRVRDRNAALPPGGYVVHPEDLAGWYARIQRPDDSERATFDPPPA